MRTLIVYESMYGNTHAVAEAIARGICAAGDVTTIPVSQAPQQDVSSYDLLIVGGPTHVHGMSRESTRRGAVEAAEKPESNLALEPDAASAGLREWLDGLTVDEGNAAAFDTRIDKPALITGRASKGISKKLRHLGFELVADPESFLVDTNTQLVDGEEARAQHWGQMLAKQSPAHT
ncbi:MULTISPECIES: flavodoxin domain-containing protein [Rhodococcus]|uniref:Flavodoxin domain-containing protein n=1 Tax=Rhodococcus oxybenzonivorans TaxID=1990687 RepID=A0AAE4V1I6_9NOCA|nr:MULTISPECIES: flavodoxin domain-containing protein [Rhodococcus]MDV7245291.1 flavodoxin domain-containing protein [Rhodococcus oxybenzonivorans]MDV7267105.1 flavodoxin domain-containing protein [Rhodococcus oxybenzonivorans]MDV7272429.1 flavodoxin domain-containing protein [Rhodococcus oxybenzonivorans]MDV7336316.1 flavodoxin domain-containing protein [Rhodococcus oxybenzonivorans]MDV7347616.1 flavodoxin domain-containing protein [Rhodococcus oxybenzonivorans]